MASRYAATAASHAEQPTLFHGSLNIEFELRHTLTVAIDASGIPREQVAERISDLSASKVSVATLNAWTAPSRKPWKIPVAIAVAFDVATNGTRILDLLALKHNRRVISPDEALDAELGAIARQEEELRLRRAEIMAALEARRVSR